MSLGYPPLRPQPDLNVVVKQASGPFGLPQLMIEGFSKAKVNVALSHPLEYSEKHWHENREQMDFAMLRNTQGIHAPLRLKLERDIASRMQRLPGLPSSNLMSDVLTGRLDNIDFEDVFQDRMDAEMVGQPHILMERRLGLL